MPAGAVAKPVRVVPSWLMPKMEYSVVPALPFSIKYMSKRSAKLLLKT